MSVINKPGFYTSKAGKCEVVAVKDGYAFGFLHSSERVRWVRVWSCENGYEADANATNNARIEGPFVEPRKPVEAWALVLKSGGYGGAFFSHDAALAKCCSLDGARLIHLREVEDEKP